MFYYKVGVTESRNQSFGLLTYSSNSDLMAGQVVRVPYGNKQTSGIVFDKSEKPEFEVKNITSVLTDLGFPDPTTLKPKDASSSFSGSESETPESGSKPVALGEDLLHSLQWLAEYYVTSISNVVNSALPKGIDKTRRVKLVNDSQLQIPALPELTKEQQDALAKLHGSAKSLIQSPSEMERAPSERKAGLLPKEDSHSYTSEEKDGLVSEGGGSAYRGAGSGSKKPTILHGITGSGKTRIYLELAKKAISAGKSAIVLTPEIGLTPQLAQEFKKHFKYIYMTHSNLGESERHQIWQEIAISDKPVIVLGTRSALFAPVSNLGLVIVDEFHDQSYKQSQKPKYDAINLSAIRTQRAGAQLVLGSATPDISRYYRSKQLQRPVVELHSKAVSTARSADMQIVDMTDSNNRHPKAWASKPLIEEINSCLKSKSQILIYHNRRGTAPLLLCEDCGHIFECSRCSIPMTLHADKHRLSCHICDKQQTVPKTCPSCTKPSIATKGFGTKQIESDLKKLFPNANIARFDTDNTEKESLKNRFEEVRNGTIQIIVGTQMVTKGLDLPKLKSVAVVLAEAGLALPDYSAQEKIYQQLYQVSGRVGRHSDSNKILIQTYQKDSPMISCLLANDWHSFYENEIKVRQQFKYPPFSFLLVLKNDYANRATAKKSASELASIIATNYRGVEVLGPSPAFHERVRGRYRWQLVIKSTDRNKLIKIAKHLPKSGKWQFELDPASLL